MKKAYLAVDIGVTGALAAVDEDGNIIKCIAMPTIESIVNKKKRNQYNIQAIDFFIIKLMAEYECRAIFERLRAFPGQSSQTGFSLGFGSALFETLFTCRVLPYEKAEPSRWQAEMMKGYNYKKDQTKIVSIQVAKQMAPGFSFKPTERCTKESSDMTDAYLMAMYLKKINNK